MAAIAESMVSLRIAGDALDPGEITALLGKEPSRAIRKGELRNANRPNIVARTGMWSLHARNHTPANLDAQISEIFDGMPDDEAVWAELGSRFYLDLFCGLFMNESNEGIEISVQSLKLLGSRGIRIGLDIYDPTRDPDPEEAK